MARWSIEPSWKKSIVEREYWTKDNNTVVFETGWRWGTFECETEDDNIPDITSGDDLWSCGYDVELIETWDGCWSEHDMDECDEETQQWLEEFLEEHSSYELEEVDGWVQGDTEMIIDCDPIFTRLDGPNEDKRYNVNGEEIVDENVTVPVGQTTELPTVEVNGVAVDLFSEDDTQWPNSKTNTKETAKWPFDNATKVETEPQAKWPFGYPEEGDKKNAN